jgi:hypothetical protein
MPGWLTYKTRTCNKKIRFYRIPGFLHHSKVFLRFRTHNTWVLTFVYIVEIQLLKLV